METDIKKKAEHAKHSYLNNEAVFGIIENGLNSRRNFEAVLYIVRDNSAFQNRIYQR